MTSLEVTTSLHEHGLRKGSPSSLSRREEETLKTPLCRAPLPVVWTQCPGCCKPPRFLAMRRRTSPVLALHCALSAYRRESKADRRVLLQEVFYFRLCVIVAAFLCYLGWFSAKLSFFFIKLSFIWVSYMRIFKISFYRILTVRQTVLILNPQPPFIFSSINTADSL